MKRESRKPEEDEEKGLREQERGGRREGCKEE
jgi:hypothetical protein